MKTQFNVLAITRQNILDNIIDLSLEQINKIPTNYNNSIGWQVSHVIVTQQLLNYKLAEVKPLISEELISHFKKGSSGKYELTESEWKNNLLLLIDLPNQLARDYNNGLFKNYSEYPTSYNFVIKSIEDSIIFNNIHEAMHFGTISTMKKLL